jgi:hypothetical protein
VTRLADHARRKGLIEGGGGKADRPPVHRGAAHLPARHGPPQARLLEADRLVGQAFRWKLAEPALPWPLTLELWRRPDGEQIMEVSVKAPAAQAAVIYFGFIAFLAEVGAERDDNQQAKTHWALDYFAAKAKQKAAAEPAPRPQAGERVTKSGRPAGRAAARGR